MMCFFSHLLYCEMYHIKEEYKKIYVDLKNKANTVLTNRD